MNQLAGSITFKGELVENDFKQNTIITNIKNGLTNIFFHGETEINSSKDFIEQFKKKIKGELTGYDISISTEDKIKLYNFKEGKYEIKVIHGENIEFEQLENSYKDGNIICIREAENSSVFGNRTIKIDYVS